MYIFVKHPFGNLNFGPYPPHLTSTYICEVTITSRCAPETSQRLDERTTKILEVCERLEAKWSTKPSSFFGRIASAFWWEKTEKGNEGKASGVENL